MKPTIQEGAGCARRGARPSVIALVAAGLATALATGGCGSAATGAPPGATPSTNPSTAGAPLAPFDQAHRLVIQAAACWSGGPWRDALGESAPSADRCDGVLMSAYGGVDPVRRERLRAVELVEVSELGDRLRRIAGAAGAPTEELGSLLNAIAAAERETMLARRAADRVKMDVEGDRQPGKRLGDEQASFAPLAASGAVSALLRATGGGLGVEARSIGLLCAMDRMEIARGLPKHLKVYAVEGTYKELFGVDPPPVPEDPARPMPGGAWLTYLTQVAAAARHPVPPRAASLRDRELMAWGGVLEGLSDRIREESTAVSDRTELRRVLEGTFRRLDSEYRASEAALAHDETSAP